MPRVARAPEPLAVEAAAPLEFTITARSDLPTVPSSAQPFERAVARALEPVRPLLAECLRALGAPARHVVRVTIDDEGALTPRPPQAFALAPADQRCLDGALRAVTVDPPPPRAMPWDVRVEVTP